MKNKILLAISLAFSTASFAQSDITFGAKAGLSSTNMRGDAVTNLNSLLENTAGILKTSSRTGFYAGAFANIPMGDGLAFEPGVYYTQKGYQLGGDLNIKGLGFLGANANAQLQNDYIDVPLLVKYNTGGFQIFGGPQFSYLTKANLNMKAGVLGINLLNKNLDVSNSFNKWDMAVTAGVGYALSKNIAVNAAYDYGLQKIDANKSLSSYNQGFKVGLAVGF